MAFPATPSNNDVHKEGNRAFVYDSALGVWDQVREIESQNKNKLLSGDIGDAVTGSLGSSITFPAGHVIQIAYTRNATEITRTGNKAAPAATGISVSLTNDLQSSSKLFCQFTTQIGEEHGGWWALQTWITLYQNGTNLAPPEANTNTTNNRAGLASCSTTGGATNGQYECQNVAGQILFSPTGSGATRRTVELWWASSGTNSFASWLNRAHNTSNSYKTGGTTMTLMEIAQ